MSNVINPNLIAQYQRLKALTDKEAHFLNQKESSLAIKENRLKEQILKDSDPLSLKQNLQTKLPNYLSPGNVGDINRVIWPFYFTTDKVTVSPNSNVRTSFTVTQEASFVWMYYTKSVFVLDTNDNSESYLDPDDTNNFATGLSFTIRDPQSQRQFFNRPIDIDHVGNPRWASTLPAPQLVLPRSSLEVNFYNDDANTTYIPSLTFFGYRIRMENANQLLSTVY